MLSHSEWWLDHPDELVDALTVAARSPESHVPPPARDTEVVISDPAWWLEHMDELTDALRVAAGIRERETDQEQDPPGAHRGVR